MYRPKFESMIPIVFLEPSYVLVDGVREKVFSEVGVIFGSFKTYGGTERDVNGVYSIVDTAVVETWFRPDVKSGCRVYLPEAGSTYEIINEPENIDARNQFMRFKVKRIKGGA